MTFFIAVVKPIVKFKNISVRPMAIVSVAALRCYVLVTIGLLLIVFNWPNSSLQSFGNIMLQTDDEGGCDGALCGR